jgi:hypothetical protein
MPLNIVWCCRRQIHTYRHSESISVYPVQYVFPRIGNMCPDSRVLCHAPSQNAITRSAYQPWRRIFPEWVARPTSTPAGNAMKNCDVELRRELTEEGVEPPRSPEAAWVQLRASDMVFYVAQ